MKTTILSFSARAGGNCDGIAALIKELVVEAHVFSFSGFALHPCGNCSYECFSEREACPYIGDMECRILEEICRSDRAFFVLPNYCDYPCANYIIFNERSQCFFQGRPELLKSYLRIPKHFVVVSNTGTENFAAALSYQTEGPPRILFLSAKQFGKVSIRGDLLSSSEARARIAAFVRG